MTRVKLQPEYDVIRVETRMEDGWSDLLAIRRSDGLPLFLELKQIDHLTKDGYTRIALEPEQGIFLFERVQASDHVGAAVVLRVGQNDVFFFPARAEVKWCHWIRSPIFPFQTEEPLCFHRHVSNLQSAARECYGARFTPAHLPARQTR